MRKARNYCSTSLLLAPLLCPAWEESLDRRDGFEDGGIGTAAETGDEDGGGTDGGGDDGGGDDGSTSGGGAALPGVIVRSGLSQSTMRCMTHCRSAALSMASKPKAK